MHVTKILAKFSLTGSALAGVAVWAVVAPCARALPVGFGVHQGPLEYSEIKSKNFYVYHDKRVPGEGAMVLHALEGARPAVESWFGTGRDEPLPVIMSAVSSNASFANFITDAVELQTLGQGSRDLAWHEYVHSSMYRTMENWLGPAGTIIHLPWMPAWYLEGLAESLSVSVGSDVMAGIERYHALTGNWPSFDRLHSLYGKYDFTLRGYATSGALVSYILRQGNPDELPKLQNDFFHYSMPWWWPWATVPFNGFMPMDESLESYSGSQGDQLYVQYKQEAREFWQSHARGPFLLEKTGRRRYFGSISGLRSQDDELLHMVRLDGDLWETKLTFDEKTGWATGFEKTRRHLDEPGSLARINGKTFRAAVGYELTTQGIESHNLQVAPPGPEADPTFRTFLKREGLIKRLYETPNQLVWLEVERETGRLCSVDKAVVEHALKTEMPAAGSVAVDCPLVLEQPYRLRPMGMKETRPGSGVASQIWLTVSEQTLVGDEHAIAVFETNPLALTEVVRKTYEPLRVGFTGKTPWVLAAEANQRTVRELTPNGTCQSVRFVKDHLVELHGLSSGHLVLGLYAGSRRNLIRVDPSELDSEPCYRAKGHMSPLLHATRAGDGSPKKGVSLANALEKTRLWQDLPVTMGEREAQSLRKASPLGRRRPSRDSHVESTSQPAQWRGRGVFAFPWIGANDALGPQLGIVSVPLMDHMQNEAVRATFLYGVQSRFPYQEVSLRSTRFRPELKLSLYRQQTWNGPFYNTQTGEIVSSYLDEKGGRLGSDTTWHFRDGRLSLGLGFKFAHLKPYLGPRHVRRGFLAEPGTNLSYFHDFGDVGFSTSLSGRVAPAAWNREFAYNQLGTATSLTFGLPLSSTGILGVEASRTRGKKMRALREVYRPLKTFVPGSGGGYNKNSFPVIGSGGLFSAVYGNTQGRAKANWTVPLISDFNTWLWLVYLERLDFTAFYNYGAAWSGPEPRSGWDKLIRAHGYNFDIQMENKGVRFNAGLGTGQVVGQEYQVYLTSGFDALF